MFPWIWMWSPVVHFPLSGAVSQDIEPQVMRVMTRRAGDPRAEARVLEEVASYGQQLGLLTEALIGVAEAAPPGDEKAREALARLREIQGKVARIKGT